MIIFLMIIILLNESCNNRTNKYITNQSYDYNTNASNTKNDDLREEEIVPCLN